MKTQVLDHGYVELIQAWGSDEQIIEAARMSTDKSFRGWGTPDNPGDEKLLARLYIDRHTSPFEQAGATFEIQCPIMVAREVHRHRTFNYNELSGRYTQMPNVHYMPEPARIMPQSTKNKQGSDENNEIPKWVKDEFVKRMRRQQELIYSDYEWALQNGIAREIARLNTPISRYTRFRMSGNLRNWFHFMGLRQAPDAQWEIRQFANVINDELLKQFPRSMELFNR